MLRQALARSPDNAATVHALGLNLVRQGRTADAVAAFGRAAELAPTDPRFSYVYAVALNSTGHGEEALRLLEANQQRHPADRATLAALATINRDRGDRPAARAWAEKLAAVDPTARGLLDTLR